MKVQTPDNKTYLVKFIHGINDGTVCTIFLQKEDGKEMVANESSHLHPKDLGKYCKKTGRKIALGRALRHLYPESKQFRQEIWKQYLKECHY